MEHKNIELTKISTPGSKSVAYMVKFGGITIGFIEKFKDTKTEVNPWKAFAARYNAALKGYHYDGETFFEVFYGKKGKGDAIEALRKRMN